MCVCVCVCDSTAAGMHCVCGVRVGGLHPRCGCGWGVVMVVGASIPGGCMSRMPFAPACDPVSPLVDPTGCWALSRAACRTQAATSMAACVHFGPPQRMMNSPSQKQCPGGRARGGGSCGGQLAVVAPWPAGELSEGVPRGLVDRARPHCLPTLRYRDLWVRHAWCYCCVAAALFTYMLAYCSSIFVITAGRFCRQVLALCGGSELRTALPCCCGTHSQDCTDTPGFVRLACLG